MKVVTMMKICLDAGHYGKYNRSPVNPKYYESDMTWKHHLLLKSELEKRGFIVEITRSNQAVDLGLESRGKKSKGCVLFLSVHSNACNDVTADNSVACCLVNDNRTNIDDISVDLGKKLADKVTEIMTGKRNEGRVYRRVGNGGSDYYGVLRGAKSVGTPAILLEHGFHTNLANTNFLLNEDNLKKMAIAEADIIAEYFHVSADDVTTDNTSVKTDVLRVKILDDALNIRKKPGVDSAIVGVIKDHGVYTIVEKRYVNGVEWGKLKSGAGWISLHSKYVMKC